jgi:hypothetical protein
LSTHIVDFAVLPYSFCLDDGESESFGDLPPGDYDVAEAATSQWKLDALVCVGGPLVR